jgi:PAS domain S-box-containing protein
MSGRQSPDNAGNARRELTRGFVFLLVGLQVLLAVVVIAGAVQYARQMRGNALEGHLNQAAANVRDVEEHLTQTLHLAGLTLANLEELSGYQPGRAVAETQARLEKMQRQMPVLRSLSFADRDGRILASSVTANVGRQVDLASLLPLAPVERPHVVRLGIPWEGRDFSDGRPTTPERPVGARANAFFPLALSLPGENALVALAAINTDYFLNRISGSFDRDLLHVAVFDYNGILLLSNESEPPAGSRSADAELLARVKESEIGQQLDGRAHDSEALTAFRASRNYPFFVVGHARHAAVLAKWREETIATFAALGFALLATLMITGLLTARLLAAYAKENRLREEQRLAASVFEHSNDGIVITDNETTILSVNPAFERISGYRADEAVGQTPRLLSSGHHDKDFYARMWQAIVEKGEWGGEIVNRRKDGSTLTEWLTILRMRDARGEQRGYIGIFHDISEMRRSEQMIRQLSAAVEQSPSSIVITTLEPAIEYVNPHFLRATGYAPEEVVGKNPRFLQSKLTPPETYRAMWDRLTAGEIWEGEFTNRRKDGSIYYEHATLAPVRNSSGQIVRYLAIKHDITERKKLEREIVEAKEAAEASNRAKSEFLANMSHEIRTPMHGIIGMTQLVLDSELSGEQRDLLAKAHGAAESLLGILNDILDFSKIDAGKLAFECIPFNLQAVLDHLRDMFGIMAESKGITLSLRCDPETPTHLVGDPTRLAQVLTNLLGNAIKFTDAGQVTLDVRPANAANAGANPVRLRFEVGDTGIGIAPEQLGRLFHAFDQGDNSITRKYGGTGLGLAISQRLVVMMGGRIEADSAPGKGSRFTFTASFARAASPVAALSQGARSPHAALAGVAVLLVEDNPLNQQLVRTLLERVGVKVTVAENGAEAIEALAGAASFDAVLMDVQMPVMDGLTATRRIRADARFAGLPIIATTAHAMADDREECLAAGMQDYLSKPIDVARLYQKLAHWTGRRIAPAAADPSPALPAPAALLAERDAAIRRMGGQADIYRLSLAAFLDDQAAAVERLRTHLVAGDLGSGHLVAHTLKGTAAVIGATPLKNAAAALDETLRAGILPPDWETQLGRIAGLLRETLEAVRKELETAEAR